MILLFWINQNQNNLIKKLRLKKNNFEKIPSEGTAHRCSLNCYTKIYYQTINSSNMISSE